MWASGRNLTLIPLLPHFDGLGKIFVSLPVDLGPLRLLVGEVAHVVQFLLVVIGLGEDVIREKVVGSEAERELETSHIGEVLQADVIQRLQSLCAANGLDATRKDKLSGSTYLFIALGD